MICPGCGTENETGRKYCEECGARLAVACPTCSAPNPPTARFCGQCGASLLEGATPVARAGASPAPVAERRLVSVLFADLVGFTSYAEDRDAEEVRDTLSRYFDLASDVIGRYGGTIEKFIGDAVMAVWGAPIAREDDAERAVRAGLELVDAIRQIGPAISVRVGILTGEAAVTIGVASQGMVAGDLVNTASRLQSAAPAGVVLVGEATMRAASRAIAFEPAGAQELRGKAAPVPAFRALRVVAELGGRNRRDALEPPFVGRTEELRLLKDLFHATGRDSRARLVSIVGPTGIGKSRLAWEFSKYADGLIGDTFWHEGHCPAYGDGVTFWALGEMVRQRAGLLETDDETTTRTRVGAAVREWIPDDAERRWIEPALLALLGVEGRAVGAEQLFGAWRTFFERMSARGTVALVFEDLHFADAGLLDFIEHVLEWSQAFPIIVVTLARPELLDRRPDWGTGKRRLTSVYPEPLPESAMRELLGGLVPGLPAPAVRSIVARADGVPLYAVETVRMLLDTGKLVFTDGTYCLAGELGDLAVPETLTELVAARLDALKPTDRSLVADAAVLGQSFSTAALAAVSVLDEPALERHLRALVRRELLTLVTDARSPERGQHTFVQALIREVAYNTLAKRDRSTRHLAAARHFESLGTDELAGAVAAHYLAAYRNLPVGPEADALAARARLTLKGAAARAAALGSHDQAVAFAEQALTVTAGPAEEAALLELAGASASAAGHHDRAETFLRRAIELHRRLGDRPATARVTAALGLALIDGWRVEDALTLLEPAVAEFADLAEVPGVLALGGQLARALFLVAQADAAVAVADRVLAGAERLDLVPVIADTLVTKGSALNDLGRGREGLGLIRTGLEIAEAHDIPITALRARHNMSAFVQEQDPAAAIRLTRETLLLSRRLGHRDATVVYNAVWPAIGCGDWDWAAVEVDDLLEADLEPEDRAIMLGLAIWLRSWRAGNVAGPLAELERLAAGADPAIASTFHEARAEVALATGRLAEAGSEFLEAGRSYPVQSFYFRMAGHAAAWDRDGGIARAVLKTLEGPLIRGRVPDVARVTVRAGLAALDDRSGEALSLYREALRGWRDIGLPVDEAFTGIDMATLLDPAEPEVQVAVESAREILARLGALPFIERLAAALARTDEPAPGSNHPGVAGRPKNDPVTEE